MKRLRPSFFTPTSPWRSLQGLFCYIRYKLKKFILIFCNCFHYFLSTSNNSLPHSLNFNLLLAPITLQINFNLNWAFQILKKDKISHFWIDTNYSGTTSSLYLPALWNACPMKCLSRGMLAQWNAMPISSGRSLFRRGGNLAWGGQA